MLWKFLVGKFHRPRQMERIFMFLDLKSSTKIAEALGHKKYFEFLRRCFADMTAAVLLYEGEIYQYVGDGIIISWPLETGVKNSNCIHCFLEIKKTINRNSDSYMTMFGIIPEFKAGLHCRSVTAGEVGHLKRDIVYSGDVLNTSARIQEQCNALNAGVLVSGRLAQKLLPINYAFILKGSATLTGKRSKINLFAVN